MTTTLERRTGEGRDKVVGGLSLARLERIRPWLGRYLDEGRIAGGLTVVARRGEVAWFEAAGMMDRERDRAMERDTIFRIYSMTKPIAAVALMMLYEDGHFQLDRPVHRYIPAWRDLRVYRSGRHPDLETVPADRPIVIGDLLSHTAGLSYGFPGGSAVDEAYRRLGVQGP